LKEAPTGIGIWLGQQVVGWHSRYV